MPGLAAEPAEQLAGIGQCPVAQRMHKGEAAGRLPGGHGQAPSLVDWLVMVLPPLAVDGRLKFLVAHAESVPGPILEIGNTNSRYRFPIGARQFVTLWNSHGPAHHCAVGIGHIASKIQKLGQLLNMEVAQVC